MQINSIIKTFKASPIREITNKARQMPNAILLAIGEPDLKPEPKLLEETLEFAKHNAMPYAPTGGGAEIRSLVAQHYNKHYGSNYDQNNIIMNVGVSESLSSLFRTILNIDDEVIIPTPYFSAYPNYVQQAYGKAVIAHADSQNNFIVTPELIEKYRTPKTKAILFSNPSNPAGTVMSKTEVETLVNYIKGTDLVLIVDEIYSDISFVPFTSFASYSEIADQCIILNGFSKSHSMTGWRLGYTIVPQKLRTYFLNAHLYAVTCPTTLSLKMGEIALEKYSDRSHICKIYQDRSEYFAQELEKLGFKVLTVQGSLYLFVSYEKISSKNSFDFTMELLEATGVTMIPGSEFGVESWLRISLTQEISVLKEAIKRITQFLS